MKEREFLERLTKRMPRSPKQVNGFFECDAEVLPWGEEFLLFSTDEFSGEDLFYTKDPYVLGRNIACAALSDILAAGGKPFYYAHSLTVDERFSRKYCEGFYDGISSVLEQAGASFIGGDFGRADQWRCCASVIGSTSRPVLRSGARPGDAIYLTGPIGAGNIQAALGLYNIPLKGLVCPGFQLRTEALPDIQKFATSCMDTSDGLFQAVRTIAVQSGVGVALENIPYLPLGRTVSRLSGLPLEMLMFCECGEYEMVFTSPSPLPYPQIGRVMEMGMTLEGKDVSKIDLSAREHRDLKSYLEEVKRICVELSLRE